MTFCFLVGPGMGSRGARSCLVAMTGHVDVEIWVSSIDSLKGHSSYVSVVRVCCILKQQTGAGAEDIGG